MGPWGLPRKHSINDLANKHEKSRNPRLLQGEVVQNPINPNNIKTTNITIAAFKRVFKFLITAYTIKNKTINLNINNKLIFNRLLRWF